MYNTESHEHGCRLDVLLKHGLPLETTADFNLPSFSGVLSLSLWVYLDSVQVSFCEHLQLTSHVPLRATIYFIKKFLVYKQELHTTTDTGHTSHGASKRISQIPLNSVFASLDHNEPSLVLWCNPQQHHLRKTRQSFSVTVNVSNSATESNFMNKWRERNEA